MAEKGVYTIAKYLPMRLRRKMVAPSYRWSEDDDSRICATGRCPLGWLFADPPKGKLKQGQRLPGSTTVARRIKKLFPALTKNVTSGDIVDAASDFIEDWDERKIKNLRKALGVPK